MVQYATAAELAGFMKVDSVDTYSADQALTLASETFSSLADVWFTPQSVTYRTTGTRATNIVLPFSKVTAVSAVRINGVTVTGYTLIGNRLYRSAGFGTYPGAVPDLLEVDLTHGATTAPGDVKNAVLESAAGIYQHPDPAVVSETIDDYRVQYATGSRLTSSAEKLAAWYRGSWAW